jgi:hypothetical protein
MEEKEGGKRPIFTEASTTKTAIRTLMKYYKFWQLKNRISGRMDMDFDVSNIIAAMKQTYRSRGNFRDIE